MVQSERREPSRCPALKKIESRKNTLTLQIAFPSRSIVNRFCKDHFAQSYKQTIGLDFHMKHISLPGTCLCLADFMSGILTVLLILTHRLHR